MNRLVSTAVLILFFLPLWGQTFPELEFHGHYLFRVNNLYVSPRSINDKLGFELRRAYFDVRMKFNDRFRVRWTPDVMFNGQDTPFVRLKYAYATYVLGDLGLFENIRLSLGQLPRPWISYQERFNKYKVFGDMLLETAGVVNSTDRGISLETDLGGKSDDTTLIGEKGRYGSLMIGIYNGGGYMQGEYNSAKTFEFRLSLRPLPETLPHLLYVVTGVAGKPNFNGPVNLDYDSSKVLVLNQYLVYATRKIIIAGQFEAGTGDVFGDNYLEYVISSYGFGLKSRQHYGFSLFGDFAVTDKLFIFGRYDFFKIVRDNEVLNSVYTGFRYGLNSWSFAAVQYQYDFLANRHLVNAGVQIKF